MRPPQVIRLDLMIHITSKYTGLIDCFILTAYCLTGRSQLCGMCVMSLCWLSWADWVNWGQRFNVIIVSFLTPTIASYITCKLHLSVSYHFHIVCIWPYFYIDRSMWWWQLGGTTAKWGTAVKMAGQYLQALNHCMELREMSSWVCGDFSHICVNKTRWPRDTYWCIWGD